jgi:ankyrin repeat protein
MKADDDATEGELKEGLRRALCPHTGEQADVPEALSLIRRGAPLGLYENGWVSPLFHAAALGSTEVIEEILDKGVPVDQRSSDGMTPLMVAARDGKFDALKLLIRKDADVHAEMNDGTNVLWFARFNAHPECAEALKNADRERAEFREAIATAHIAQRPITVRPQLRLRK